MLSRLLVKRLRTGIRQNSYKDENLTAHEKLRIWKEYLIRKYNNSKYYKIVSIAGKVSLVFGFIGAGKLFLVNDTKAVFNDMYGQVRSKIYIYNSFFYSRDENCYEGNSRQYNILTLVNA